MANTGEQGKKGNAAERGLRFLRDVHIAIGAVALAGAIVFTQIIALPLIAAYEGANAAIHEGLRQVVKNRSNYQPKPA